MAFVATFTGSERYVQFLSAYPYPAFVLDGRHRPGKLGTALHPVYGNIPYLRFIFGVDSAASAVLPISSGSASLGGLVEALVDIQEGRRLSAWLYRLPDNDATAKPTSMADYTIVLSLRPTWLPSASPALQLEVTKTFIDGFWVCTSVPRSDIPLLPSRAPSPNGSASSGKSRRTSPKLRIPNFPPPPTFAPRSLSQPNGFHTFKPDILMSRLEPVASSYTGSNAPLSTSSGKQEFGCNSVANSLEADTSYFSRVSTLVPPSSQIGQMERMVEAYPWETTDLGPRAGWSQALKTALSICLQSPTSCALLWGPSLVLIYNDKYADMAGTKHPRIFAKQGSDAWGELWEQLGPLGEIVLSGESVARWDDLMFFERLTSADLPEELYHSWSWIPVKGENGVVEGIINWSIETTQKVIAERRLLTLRTMGERAKLSKNVLQLTSALLSVLEQNKADFPFAAFYYCQTPNLLPRQRENSGSGSASSYIRSSFDQPPVQLSFHLAGSIGIPASHPATPPSRELFLDPVTLHPIPSPRLHSRSGGLDTTIPCDPSPVPLLNLNAVTLSRLSSTDSSLASGSVGTTPKSGLTLIDDSTVSNGFAANISDRLSPTTSEHAISPSKESTFSGSSSSVCTPWRWPIPEAVASRRPVLVSTLPAEVAETLSRRAWGDVPRQAVVVPIWAYEGDSSDSALPQAVLILGLNPRRPYDRDYEEWVDLLRASLGLSLAAVLSWEAETQRAEQLAQLDAAKTSFFSNVSHELRTPLTLILGPIQDAVTVSNEPKLKETLKLALRNVSRLSRLVDSLMDFTRIEAGKLLGNFKPVQLGSFTADLAALFRSTIEKNHIEFNVKCDTNSHVLCYVDPDLWEKIVFNLIGNAFKFTMQGSITVRLQFQGQEVIFAIEDTGVGIPQEDVIKVFQRFHRVTSISRSHEGTGIGLSLTRELVRLHGGTISVVSRTESESSDGSHGSVFTVTLPLGKDHLPPTHVDDTMSETHRHQHYARGIVEEATHWSRQSDPMKTPSDSSDSGGSNESSRMDATTLFFMKKDVLLLVDDSSDMRQFIKSIFVEFCTVIEARHGQEALELIDKGLRPTVIVSDVMMPVLDGYSLMKAIRERPDTRLLPIIFLTAKAGEEARVDGLLSGADDYIAKPFQGRELVARVHLQMQLGKRRAELEARFEERQREVQILSDNSPIGIVRTNPNGRIIYVNRRWYELTGRVGCPLDDWMDSVHPEHLEAVRTFWGEVFDDRLGRSLEFRWQNGVWTKGQTVPLGQERNVWAGVLFTITDISDQRLYEASQLSHAQEREASARRRAEEAEERRKDADERRRAQELLIDVTSHELRQPVSAILNCSALVRENLASLRDNLRGCYNKGSSFVPQEALLRVIDEDLEALDSIYQCGLAQERIANDVLSLSRIQLQVLSIHPVEFELVPEVRRIVAIFNNELKMKGISMYLHFGESIRKLRIRRIRSDKSRLAQVLTNLLSNAIKFADTSVDKREIEVNVEVSFGPPDQGNCLPPSEDEAPDDPAAPIYLYVAVKDSGPGLKPDDLTLLFKRFQQGSNSHDVFGGSGLGLFVSRKLCDLMDGRINVDSIYGQGATFRFFIQASNSPMGPENREITASDLSNERRATRPGPRSPEIGRRAGGTAHPHILITEDNLINQTVLNRQLKGAGFITTLASNGQQAIERIRALAFTYNAQPVLSKLFDAILMDCEMPVMDGLTAVREIRRLEASGELPGRNRIYALTGNARAGQVQSALDAGMDEVLIKPYRLDELLFKLREC
ncbi:hypothetical protein K439DRAFT_1640612 [Ramaria rubella]|nr:hypothetical protein K439DRAFT_1640612 [Ramaria rubella]